MQQVIMPKLGLTMESGRIVKWLKKEGEKVMRDEALVEIETEKVTMFIESPAEGVLAQIIAMEGQEVSVSKPIAILTSEGEIIPNSLEAPAVEKEQTREPQDRASVTTSREEVRISPLARKIAEKDGIDISKLRGTGPDGRVVREDVLKAIEDGKRAASKVSEVSQDIRIEYLSGLRKNVAERMTLSSQTIPQVTLQTEADLTETVNFHQDYAAKMEKSVGVHVTFTDVIVKATAKALREYPRLNSTFVDNGIRLNENINIGIAVAVDTGLIVPVVPDADKTALAELAKTSKELAEKARLGKLTIEDVSNGTFTISNLGMFAIDSFNPLINPPQIGILGVGQIVKKPSVIADQILVRSLMSLSLTFDHRVTDGAEAAKFLGRIKNLLEHSFHLLEN